MMIGLAATLLIVVALALAMAPNRSPDTSAVTQASAIPCECDDNPYADKPMLVLAQPPVLTITPGFVQRVD
jgi:hypothetical protein